MLFAGLTVAISVAGLAFIGLDFVTKLGIGSSLGVLTTVLIANSLLIAVLALLGHKVDRLKVPFTKPFDDSEEARDKTLIARWGRFVTRNAKVVFPVLLIVGFVLAGDLGTRAPRRRRPGDAAPGADEPPRLRPARRGLRAGLQRPDPDRHRREGRQAGPAANLRRCPGDEGCRLGARAAVQRREDGRDRVRDAELGAAGRRHRQPRRPAAERHRAGRDEGRRRPSRTSPARPPRSRTSPTRSSAGCRSSCSSSSA